MFAPMFDDITSLINDSDIVSDMTRAGRAMLRQSLRRHRCNKQTRNIHKTENMTNDEGGKTS